MTEKSPVGRRFLLGLICFYVIDAINSEAGTNDFEDINISKIQNDYFYVLFNNCKKNSTYAKISGVVYVTTYYSGTSTISNVDLPAPKTNFTISLSASHSIEILTENRVRFGAYNEVNRVGDSYTFTDECYILASAE